MKVTFKGDQPLIFSFYESTHFIGSKSYNLDLK